ncbi:hypothetical protein SMICM304S_11015 [Streptomyces microflavus]
MRLDRARFVGADRARLRAQQQTEQCQIRPFGPGLLGELPSAVGRTGILRAHMRTMSLLVPAAVPCPRPAPRSGPRQAGRKWW